MEFVWFALIGICAGWLAGQITKGSGFGLIGDLIVGVIGAVLGAVLFKNVNIGVEGLAGQLIVATVGAVILLLLLRLVPKKKPAA